MKMRFVPRPYRFKNNAAQFRRPYIIESCDGTVVEDSNLAIARSSHPSDRGVSYFQASRALCIDPIHLVKAIGHACKVPVWPMVFNSNESWVYNFCLPTFVSISCSCNSTGACLSGHKNCHMCTYVCAPFLPQHEHAILDLRLHLGL